VAVELVEYIGGAGRFNSFFRKCAELISEDGVIVLHSVGCSEGADRTDPFIAKYITPGSYYIPALSQLLRAIERAGLLVTDIEVLGPHYSETLKAWRERLLEHRAEIERLYGARFYRMWEFWSAGSEIAFRQWGVTVFQIQWTKRQGVVPITREYIAREESRLRGIEPGRSLPHKLAGE
jgi:cyclopropane-fatty-acyl-phospholipid synthase